MSEQTVVINWSPDQPRLYARDLPGLIEHYLCERGRTCEAKTARGYAYKLDHFLAWWREVGPACGWMLTDVQLAEFAEHLGHVTSARGGPLSWHSRNDVLRRLAQVFRWAHRRGYLTVDFADMVPAMKGQPPVRRPPALDVVAGMMEAALSTRQPLRNRAIVAVLAGTGVRLEECAALRVENVTLYADGCGSIVLEVAKLDKPRVVAFDAETGQVLRVWLERLPAAGWLFPSRKGNGPLTPAGLYKIVRVMAEAAGVGDRIRGPHDLRRLFATQWTRSLRGEGYGQLLQKQMGHASYDMTAQYSLQDVEDVLEVMRSAPATPLAKLRRGA